MASPDEKFTEAESKSKKNSSPNDGNSSLDSSRAMSRNARAAYAQGHPGVTYKSRSSNPHATSMGDISRLFPRSRRPSFTNPTKTAFVSHKRQPEVDNSEDGPWNSRGFQEGHLADSSSVGLQETFDESAPRAYNGTTSSSIPDRNWPARNEVDQTKSHEQNLDSKIIRHHTPDAHFGDFDDHSTCTVTCGWELPMICKDGAESSAEPSAFDVRDFLSGFITVSGDDDGFCCATCVELVTGQWQEAGGNALQVVSRAVELALLSADSSQSRPDEAHIIRTNDNLKIVIVDSTARAIRVLVMGPSEGHQQRNLAEAILWICTAIRQTPVPVSGDSKRIFKSFSSDTTIENDGQFHFHFDLKPLEKWSPNTPDDAACWTELFKSSVIAWRPLHRHWGKGIEMSFEMMVDLATVENYYSLNGGLVLLGYKTALIPVDWNKEANSFQWHFEVMDESATGFVQPSLLKAIQKEWMKLQHPSQFQEARCFIGWFEVAHVMLGTRKLLERQEQMSWSGSEQCRETLHSEGYEGALQMSFSFAPISLAFQGVKTYSKRSNVRRYTPTDSYRSTLTECRRKVALIIDSATAQAWLVPYLSLILHLCHRYFQNTNTAHTTPNPIPFVEPSCNGYETALKAMIDKGDIIVLGDPGKADSESLRQLILRIHLGFAEAVNIREEPKRGFIFATELMSIIEPPMTGTPLSKVSVSDPSSVAGSWQEIVKSVDVMGVCAGLGNAIMPVFKPGSACPDCSTLPEGGFYLAAQMHCLDALAFRARSGGTVDRIVEGSCPLGDSKTVWQCTANPWNTCHGPGHTSIWEKSPSCQILQHISTGELKTKIKPVSKFPVTKDGVVVFGDRHRAHHPMKRLLGGGRDYMQAKLMTLRPLVPQPSQAGSLERDERTT